MAETKVTAARPKYKVEVSTAWCKGCGVCVAFCPKAILITEGLDQKVKVTDESLCTGCRMCEVHCPDFAIHVEASEGKE